MISKWSFYANTPSYLIASSDHMDEYCGVRPKHLANCQRFFPTWNKAISETSTPTVSFWFHPQLKGQALTKLCARRPLWRCSTAPFKKKKKPQRTQIKLKQLLKYTPWFSQTQITHFYGSKKIYDLSADWSAPSTSKYVNEAHAA